MRKARPTSLKNHHERVPCRFYARPDILHRERALGDGEYVIPGVWTGKIGSTQVLLTREFAGTRAPTARTRDEY